MSAQQNDDETRDVRWLVRKIDEMYEQLLRYAARLRGPQLPPAEDLVQDALLTLCRLFDQGRVQEPRALAFAVLGKQIRGQFRSAQCHQRLLKVYSHGVATTQENWPQFSAPDVLAALSELELREPTAAAILRKRYLEEATMKDIADELHISVPTVYAHLKIGLAEMRAILRR